MAGSACHGSTSQAEPADPIASRLRCGAVNPVEKVATTPLGKCRMPSNRRSTPLGPVVANPYTRSGSWPASSRAPLRQ